MTQPIHDIEALRAVYGVPSDRARLKQLDRLDQHARRFISMSPFCVVATASADGMVDASPKGDAPGFTQVVDDHTLLFPDRPGNNRVDGHMNLMSNPGIGLLFFIPGLRETLRVNGTAELSTDPARLQLLTAQGKPPKAALIVSVQEVYMHCGKAMIRSKIWDPASQIAPGAFPSLGQVLADQIDGVDAAQAERDTEEAYREKLY
jgi:uncharacterized protein